jgi:hypothetical protein
MCRIYNIVLKLESSYYKLDHVAQLVEQRSFKPEVLGSNPSMARVLKLIFRWRVIDNNMSRRKNVFVYVKFRFSNSIYIVSLVYYD